MVYLPPEVRCFRYVFEVQSYLQPPGVWKPRVSCIGKIYMHPPPHGMVFWAPNLRLGHRWATGASINPSLKNLWIEEIATFMCLGNLKRSEGCPPPPGQCHWTPSRPLVWLQRDCQNHYLKVNIDGRDNF